MRKGTNIYIRSYDSDMKQSNSRSIGFCGLLTLIFITLKLTGHIDWSWWWVLGPLWIPVTALASVALILWCTGETLEWWQKRRKR